MEEDILLEKAKKRVEDKKGLYWHIVIYLLGILFFLAMNLFITGIDKIWFYYPILPWGFAILIHTVSVVGIPGLNILNDEWEEEELEREIERLKDEKRKYLQEHHKDLLDINEKDYIKLKDWDKLELDN